jgi:hypothetical protein
MNKEEQKQLLDSITEHFSKLVDNSNKSAGVTYSNLISGLKKTFENFMETNKEEHEKILNRITPLERWTERFFGGISVLIFLSGFFVWSFNSQKVELQNQINNLEKEISNIQTK